MSKGSDSDLPSFGETQDPDAGYIQSSHKVADESVDHDTGENADFAQDTPVGAPVKTAKGSNLVQLQPMSPLVASSTVVNLLLATGPFT